MNWVHYSLFGLNDFIYSVKAFFDFIICELSQQLQVEIALNCQS